MWFRCGNGEAGVRLVEWARRLGADLGAGGCLFRGANLALRCQPPLRQAAKPHGGGVAWPLVLTAGRLSQGPEGRAGAGIGYALVEGPPGVLGRIVTQNSVCARSIAASDNCPCGSAICPLQVRACDATLRSMVIRFVRRPASAIAECWIYQMAARATATNQ